MVQKKETKEGQRGLSLTNGPTEGALS